MLLMGIFEYLFATNLLSIQPPASTAATNITTLSSKKRSIEARGMLSTPQSPSKSKLGEVEELE